MKRYFHIAAAAVFFSLTVSAQNAAVMIKDFAAKNVSAGDVSAVTDIFQNAIVGSRKFRIIERTGLADILKEQELQLTGATDTNYAVAVGKIVSVNYLFAGSVSRLGSTYLVSVRLINVETAEIENSWEADAAGIDALIPAVRGLAAKAGGIQTVTAMNTLSPGAYVDKTVANRDALTVIDFGNIKATDADLIAKIKYPEKIRVLRLGNSLVSDHFMRNAVSRMVNLEAVDLRNCQNITEDAALQGFKDLKKLHTVQVSESVRLGDRFVALIAGNNKQLKSLRIASIRTTDAAFQSLSSLSGMKDIFHDGDITKVSDAAFLPFIQANPNLETIFMTHDALTDASVDGMIKYLKMPRSITLDGNTISAEAVARLKKAFPKCAVFCRNEIMYTGAAVTDQFISDHTNDIMKADVIIVRETRITDKGAQMIFQNARKAFAVKVIASDAVTDRSILESIQDMRRYSSLDLTLCRNISDNAIRAIVDVSPLLWHVKLSYTAVTQDGIEYIKKKFPKCTVIY